MTPKESGRNVDRKAFLVALLGVSAFGALHSASIAPNILDADYNNGVALGLGSLAAITAFDMGREINGDSSTRDFNKALVWGGAAVVAAGAVDMSTVHILNSSFESGVMLPAVEAVVANAIMTKVKPNPRRNTRI